MGKKFMISKNISSKMWKIHDELRVEDELEAISREEIRDKVRVVSLNIDWGINREIALSSVFPPHPSSSSFIASFPLTEIIGQRYG